jgi:hypothetical protein
MNDFELFRAMNDAEKKYDELRNEFRKRGLHRKAYVEFSHFDPDIPDIPGLKEFLKSKRGEGR